MKHLLAILFTFFILNSCKETNTPKIDNSSSLIYDGMTVEALTRDDNYGFYYGNIKNSSNKSIIISKDSKTLNVYICLPENIDKFGYSNFTYTDKSTFQIIATDLYNGEYTDTSNGKKIIFKNFGF